MTTTDQADAGGPRRDEVDHDTVPPARTGLLVVAGVLLVIPIVALLWVPSYAGRAEALRLPLLLLVPVPLGLPLLGD